MNCSICNSTNKVFINKKIKKPICQKHRNQISYHGKILKRGERDRNCIIEKGNHCLMELYNKYGEVIEYTKIDIDIAKKIQKYKWHLKIRRNTKYANGYYKGKIIGLHNFVFGDKYIDHINNDGLDNRLCNLRKATPSQQNMNKPLQANNTSGCKGVYFKRKKINGKIYEYWETYLFINKKRIYLGGFKNKKDAIKKRTEEEIKYHKEFRYENNI